MRDKLKRLLRINVSVFGVDRNSRTDELEQLLRKVVEGEMGVVKETLNTIHSHILEGREELLAKIDDLASRTTLDDEDKAALEEVRVAAEALKNIVPDAVTDPLPDPDTAPEVGGEEPVVDPAAPVDETGTVDGGAEGDGSGTETPVTDDSTVAPGEGEGVDAPAPSADDTTGEDVGPAVEEPATDDTGEVAPAPADTGTVEEPPAPVTPEDTGDAGEAPSVDEAAPAADDTATDSGDSGVATEDGGTTNA